METIEIAKFIHFIHYNVFLDNIPNDYSLSFSRLIQIEQEWVPHAESSSLYIRPTLIGTEPTLGVGAANEVLLFVILSPVGPYFASGLKPVNLLADPNFVRAWPGGCGYAKMGSNYAPTMWTQVTKFISNHWHILPLF